MRGARSERGGGALYDALLRPVVQHAQFGGSVVRVERRDYTSGVGR